jgi:hypothetical protein
VLHRWDPAPLLDVLALEGGARAEARTALGGAGAGIPADGIVERFRTALAEHVADGGHPGMA